MSNKPIDSDSSLMAVDHPRLVRLSDVTDDILDAVETEVGMGCGAWDCVPPKEIIAAAWKLMPGADAKPIAWYHEDFGVIELSRIQRVGWQPLYSLPNAERIRAETNIMNTQSNLSASDGATCSRLVLQRRYRPGYGIPKPWAEWHDHPEPHQIAWGAGQYATPEENMKAACESYYALGQGCEFRMVRRTDKTLWEYSANAEL